jgi:hypothetical protein
MRPQVVEDDDVALREGPARRSGRSKQSIGKRRQHEHELTYILMSCRWWIRCAMLIDRLIVVGLDGRDPAMTRRFMREGLLPHFKKLMKAGRYRRLRTNFPAVVS